MAIHGNKNTRNKKLLAEAVIETEEIGIALKFPQNIKKHMLTILSQREIYLGGGALVIAGFAANILNYFFNAYLGRILSYGDFSLIGLIGGFLSFASILFGAYGLTFSYNNSFLIGRYGDATGYGHWKHSKNRVLLPSLIATGIWFLLTPFLMNFFHTNNVYLFILFGLVLLIGFISNINQGFLSAKFLFGALAILTLLDPIVRLTVMFSLARFGLQSWAFAAIPSAAFIGFMISFVLINRKVRKEKKATPAADVTLFSKRFFYASLLTSVSSIAFFTVDIFLAKHFLSPTDAGKYTLVSLAGKMIYFLGNLTSPFIIPLISRYEGARKNSLHALYLLIGVTALFSGVGFLLFGVLGRYTIPFLYGQKAVAIVPNLLYYTFGMMCYTVSMVLINYYLVRKIYTFTIATSLLVIVQIALISLFHNNVESIAKVMSLILFIHLVISLSLHLSVKQVTLFEEKLTKLVRPIFVTSHKINKKSIQKLFVK